MSTDNPTLRSQQWFGRQDKNGFYYRSWLKNRGFPQDLFEGRPVIGICNTWSELTPCNTHFQTLADHVRWGVLEAGGFPLEFPAMSPGETLTRPSAMLYRNLAAMEVEESIRSNPLDGVVLLMGCDKTTPSLLMGAASVDIPTIGISAGPMLRGVYRGTYIGSGTTTISMGEQLRAGEITLDEYHEAEACMHRSHGTCMTMGTASTMACMVESLGISLPGNAAIPAVDARRNLLSRESGRRIVDLVRQDVKMSGIITRESLENAIRVNAAIGGSTNAVIHHIALARRMNLEMSLDDWDTLGRNVPCLLNIMPQGNFLMEDFFEAGGLPAILRELGEHNLLHRDALTVNGKTIWQNNQNAPNWRPEVIHTFTEPFKPVGGIAVLKGNLAPSGAVLKPSAASDALTKHTGPAVVFSTIEDLRARINDDSLDIDENSVMVLQNCGPRGYPGMAEVGNLPLPPKLLKRGITDMVRISDARMSGTAYGTVVLHCAPEAAVGGNLALVQNGDLITLDLESRTLELHVSDEDLAVRRALWQPPTNTPDRGYTKLYIEHVMQADVGADFDFLVGRSGSTVPRNNF
ncbi:IlvD/Edd family dehydratase [Terriglobus sp.]|uniref:IlvD/Edd family dehydratase n=1 Tax=Terriglobus sp. TaxID=1889013 RepID=UPI003AFFDB74